jgi:SAM-dependent methyltransferase
VGVDRNEKMLNRLRADFEVVAGEVPPLPAAIGDGSCDVAYSAFVVEHLADGTDAFRYIAEMKRAVRPGGLVVIVVPDAASLGLEFWNLDYTHRYPTQERNVTQILLENELAIRRVFRYRGAGWTGLRYWLARVASWFYHYRFWSALTGNKLLPYSVYQYLNQDILVFIAEKQAAGS